MKILTALATLSLIAAPVQAGGHQFNVGFTAGLTYQLGCRTVRGEMTTAKASKVMVALMRQKGIPTSYIGRADVMKVATTMLAAQSC